MMSMELLEKLQEIKLAVFDIDGVLAPNLIYNHDGQELKCFSAKDGFGIKLLKKANIQTAVITGRTCLAVQKRIEALHFDYFYQGKSNKLPALQELQQKAGLTKDETLYMGDDILDLAVKPFVSVFVAPADAVDRVLAEADHVTQRRGGEGCAREAIDWLLARQSKLTDLENTFINQED